MDARKQRLTSLASFPRGRPETLKVVSFTPAVSWTLTQCVRHLSFHGEDQQDQHIQLPGT